MFRHYALFLLALFFCAAASAQDNLEVKYDNGHNTDSVKYHPMSQPWAISVQYGRTLAFGDDSWNLKDDISNAQGEAVSISLAYQINPLFTACIKGRWLKLYNRINLEVLDAYKDKYPAFFPRDGFYGYNVMAFEAEGMLNLTNLIAHRNNYFFNMYLIAGVGFNTCYGYDKNIENWDGSYGFSYHVDTRTHTMPLGTIGGMLDFRICKEISINLELLGTFTGDKMEGVKYEEGYDVYITGSVGATLHF